mgnify:FL=1
MSALALLSLARRFWPYIAAALLIAALAFAVIRYGNNREREGIAKERATWQPVVAAIKVRNAEIERLRLVSATAIAATDDALERADSARKSQAALSARLKAAARAKPAVPCAVADVNKEAWGVVQ